MASRVVRSGLVAALTVAALLAFVPAAAADPVTYKTVTAKQIQAASLSTRSIVSMNIIAAMYASGYQGDPNQLAAALLASYDKAGGTSWLDALATYHARSVHGITNPADIAYAHRVLTAAEHVPPALSGAMSAGSALTLAAVIAGAEVAGGLGGLWDEAAAAAGGAGAAGKVVSKVGGVLKSGGKALLKDAARAGTAAAILAGLGHAVKYLNGQLEGELMSGSTVGLAELRSGSFGRVYLVAAGISVLIALALFVMAVGQAAVVGSGSAMARAALVEVPKATVGALAAPVLVVLVGTALDGMAAGLVHQAQGHVHQWFTDLGSGALAHVTEWVLSGIGNLILVTALLAAWVELALRKLLLAVILVFLPLAMAGEIHPRFRHWGPPLRRLIVALVVVKLLLALVVLLGSALPDMTNNWLLHLVGGGLILGIAAYAPYFFLRHAPMTAEMAGGGSMSHRDDFSRHVGGPAALDSAGMAQWLADLRSSDRAARDDEQTRARDQGNAGTRDGATGGGGDTPSVTQPDSRSEDGRAAGEGTAPNASADGGGSDAPRVGSPRSGDGRAGPGPGAAGSPTAGSGGDGQAASDRSGGVSDRGGSGGRRSWSPEGGAQQAPPDAGEVIHLREHRTGESPAAGGREGSSGVVGDGASDVPSAPPEGSGGFTGDQRGGGGDE